MKKTIIIVSIFVFVLAVGFIAGGTNFDRLILGEGNFGTDPNTTADITFQNDEYVSNSVDGTLDFGAANITTTGTLTTATFIKGRDTLNGAVDSLKNAGILATDYIVYTVNWTSGVVMDTVDAVNTVITAGKVTFTRADATNGALIYDYIITK